MHTACRILIVSDCGRKDISVTTSIPSLHTNDFISRNKNIKLYKNDWAIQDSNHNELYLNWRSSREDGKAQECFHNNKKHRWARMKINTNNWKVSNLGSRAIAARDCPSLWRKKRNEWLRYYQRVKESYSILVNENLGYQYFLKNIDQVAGTHRELTNKIGNLNFQVNSPRYWK